MSLNYENWTYEDYVAFVLLHVAKADFNISIEESNILDECISSDRLKELKKIHKNNSDFENVNIIMKLGSKYCSEKTEKEKLMERVMELIMADDEYNIYEKNMKRSLEILLS